MNDKSLLFQMREMRDRAIINKWQGKNEVEITLTVQIYKRIIEIILGMNSADYDYVGSPSYAINGVINNDQDLMLKCRSSLSDIIINEQEAQPESQILLVHIKNYVFLRMAEIVIGRILDDE